MTSFRYLLQLSKTDVRATMRRMAHYRVQFVDHGGNVYCGHEFEHEGDDAAIEKAHRESTKHARGA